MKAFIYVLGSVKQVRLGGSGCVDRPASFPKSTFGWHLFLISAGGYPKTYTAASSSTESIPYCWYHPAYLTALSSELLLPRPARSPPRRCTSEVSRLQVFVVIPLCVCVCVCVCARARVRVRAYTWMGVWVCVHAHVRERAVQHTCSRSLPHIMWCHSYVNIQRFVCYPEKSIWT